jgi:hypothetical protein
MTAVQRIDPRLSRQLAAAGDEEVVHAIVIVGSGDDPASRPPDASPAANLIAEVSARVGRSPVRVRQVPRGNAVIITACGRHLRALLDDPRVIVASATTIDVFPW